MILNKTYKRLNSKPFPLPGTIKSLKKVSSKKKNLNPFLKLSVVIVILKSKVDKNVVELGVLKTNNKKYICFRVCMKNTKSLIVIDRGICFFCSRID